MGKTKRHGSSHENKSDGQRRRESSNGDGGSHDGERTHHESNHVSLKSSSAGTQAAPSASHEHSHVHKKSKRSGHKHHKHSKHSSHHHDDDDDESDHRRSKHSKHRHKSHSSSKSRSSGSILSLTLASLKTQPPIPALPPACKAIPTTASAIRSDPSAQHRHVPLCPPATVPKRPCLIPQSQKEYLAEQSVLRKVYDADSGRTRLIRGSGEVVEEIVTRDQQRFINATSTASDGAMFIQGLTRLTLPYTK
ncbi:hypothetical protein BASA60_001983 [Batrachochytrium salamandrivorans]|nr:hypothetical protein BASA60_001983 [Batrachochytrium salamandrivorans]